MPCSSSRKRIAVIAPRRRGWVWHQRIIAALEQTYDVDVYVNELAPCYPFLLRCWLFVESWLVEELPLTKFTALNARAWRNVNTRNYCLVVNLSEVPLGDSIVPILETRFEGQVDSLSLIATLFSRGNPFLSIWAAGWQEPIVASYLAIPDKVSLLRGLQLSFARLIALTRRAVSRLTQGTCAAMMPKQHGPSLDYSRWRLFLFVARFFIEKLSNQSFRRFQHREHWSIALFVGDQWNIPNNVPLQKFRILSDDGQRFYADPFLFTHNDRTWLFVEEVDYRVGKGVISCANVVEGRVSEPLRRVLERPYHLSYPFVFSRNGDVFMIPETGSNRSVELYRARTFPSEWELLQVLLEGIELYDVTVLQHENRWWLFAAAAHEGGSTQDELVIYHSESLEGQWLAHPLNPVKSDCRSARPAGHIIVDGDRLLRPAQNCEHGYGTALVWLQIEELTLHGFRERQIAQWPGNVPLYADGIHTFNRDGRLGVIDIRRVNWKWPFHGLNKTELRSDGLMISNE